MVSKGYQKSIVRCRAGISIPSVTFEIKYICQIRAWIDGCDGPNIFWLSGCAGTGKSVEDESID